MTKIEWTDKAWNPVTGCTPISEGCENCYATRMSKRLAGRYGYPEAPNSFRVTPHWDRLKEPLHWQKPRMVFVCSMGDLFHEDISDSFIFAVFLVMSRTRGIGHTFQILTKRPGRMRDLIQKWIRDRVTFHEGCTGRIPSFIWLGMTAENQARWDERVPILLDTPAAVRFVSCEPLLEPINISQHLFPFTDCAHYNQGCTRPENVHGTWENGTPRSGLDSCSPGKCVFGKRSIDWLIVGGETGQKARPMDPDWARALRDQCQESGVSFFFKNGGQWMRQQEYQEHDPTASGWAERLINSKTTTLNGDIFVKMKASRLLDGREWNELPEVPNAKAD